MKKSEALERIEIISEAFDASNRIFLSSKIMIVYRIILLLIPVFEYTTDYMSFGFQALKKEPLSPIVHIIYSNTLKI